MNKQNYLHLIESVSKTPLRKTLVSVLCRLSPVVIFFIYIHGSIDLFFRLKNDFHPAYTLFWLVPAAGLVLVSLVRKKINSPRPYDLFGFTPLLPHEKGNSFPSRHTASAFLITCALFWLSRTFVSPFSLALRCLVFAVITGISRVAAGVHFPKDVIGGAVFSIVFSVICYSFLPALFFMIFGK